MQFEIFDGWQSLGYRDAPHEEAAVLMLVNQCRADEGAFKTLDELRQSEHPHREATAVLVYSMLPDGPVTAHERDGYVTAFDLVCSLADAQRDAARLRQACDRTTGLEREANIRQASEADAEVARIQAALRGEDQDRHHQEESGAAVDAPQQDKVGSASHAERTRADDIGIEIDLAIAELEQRGERITATTVMPLLRAKAGRPYNCISEVAADGVIWIRPSTGKPDKLTMEALKKRINRLKKGH